MERLRKCEHCICKTCAIAFNNGGAPGCGDCNSCLKDSHRIGTNCCRDYYNADSIVIKCREECR